MVLPMDYGDFLAKQVKADRLSQAYMIAGKYFDGEKIREELASIIGSSREDVLEIVGTPAISIDQIKTVKREMGFPPFNSLRKVAIITPAEGMTIQAQNALLKILEEPATRSIIFLLTNDEDRILGTIRSRCQRIRIKEREREWQKIPENLREMTVQEKFALAEEMAKIENCQEVLDGWLVNCWEKLSVDAKKKELLQFMSEINLAKNMLRSNSNAKLVLENLMLKF